MRYLKLLNLIKCFSIPKKTTLSSIFLFWVLIVEEEGSFHSYIPFVILHCVWHGTKNQFNRRIMSIAPFFNQRKHLKRLNLDF